MQKKSKNQNILIVGIGGQGVVLAGKIISSAAFNSGLDIKTSEVHGMSQRGGSVSTHIRYGEKIYSPLIPNNCADIIISFDIYETLRYVNAYANEKTIIISSDFGKIPPMKEKTIYKCDNDIENNTHSSEKYAEKIYNDEKLYNKSVNHNLLSIPEIISSLKQSYDNAYFIDAREISSALKNDRVSNMVLIGFMSNFTPIGREIWIKTIENILPEKIVNVNKSAFEAGNGVARYE